MNAIPISFSLIISIKGTLRIILSMIGLFAPMPFAIPMAGGIGLVFLCVVPGNIVNDKYFASRLRFFPSLQQDAKFCVESEMIEINSPHYSV